MGNDSYALTNMNALDIPVQVSGGMNDNHALIYNPSTRKFERQPQGFGIRRVAKIAFGATELGGTETNTSFTFPASGAVALAAWIYVSDSESGTMDVGTQGTSNDPDGLLDGISLSSTGWVFPTATHTTGLNADYVSATTFGALTHDIELGADLATDIGYVWPRMAFITGSDPVSITSSGDLNSCSGYLFIDYLELPTVS